MKRLEDMYCPPEVLEELRQYDSRKRAVQPPTQARQTLERIAAMRTADDEARLAQAEAKRARRRDRRLLAIVHGKAGAA